MLLRLQLLTQVDIFQQRVHNSLASWVIKEITDISIRSQVMLLMSCVEGWKVGNSNLSLDHVNAVVPHLTYTSKHVDSVLGFCLVQEIIHCNEGSCATNSGTAVYDCWARLIVRAATELPMKCQQRCWVEWDTVIRPHREVKLSNCKCRSILQTQEHALSTHSCSIMP